MCVISCCVDNDRFTDEVKNLYEYLKESDHEMIRVDENALQFMSVLEIKHKSSSVSVCSVRNIVGVHLSNITYLMKMI